MVTEAGTKETLRRNEGNSLNSQGSQMKWARPIDRGRSQGLKMACASRVALRIVALVVLASAASGYDELCTKDSDCKERNEVCLLSAHKCKCSRTTTRFASDCVGVRRHGEECLLQIECSMSGDPFLQCQQGMCQCGVGRAFSSDADMCELDDDQRAKVNKMGPKDHSDDAFLINDRIGVTNVK